MERSDHEASAVQRATLPLPRSRCSLVSIGGTTRNSRKDYPPEDKWNNRENGKKVSSLGYFCSGIPFHFCPFRRDSGIIAAITEEFLEKSFIF
jgi:hypothetical protein